jgi:hypothetical protein
MTTSLRPILGREKFFLTDEKMFFIQHWIEVSDQSLPKTSAHTEVPTP